MMKSCHELCSAYGSQSNKTIMCASYEGIPVAIA